MVKGIRAYDEKERRKVRRENHKEKDLRYPKRGRGFSRRFDDDDYNDV